MLLSFVMILSFCLNNSLIYVHASSGDGNVSVDSDVQSDDEKSFNLDRLLEHNKQILSKSVDDGMFVDAPVATLFRVAADSVDKSGLNSVGGFDWVINSGKVSLNNLRSLDSLSGRFKVYDWNNAAMSIGKILWYEWSCDWRTSGYLSYNGVRDFCTLVFKDAATSASGVTADLRIVISDIYCTGQFATPNSGAMAGVPYDGGAGNDCPVIISDYFGEYTGISTSAESWGGASGVADFYGRKGRHMTFTYSLLESGTNRVIDNQTMLAVFSDIDVNGNDNSFNGGFANFVEGVRVNSGAESSVYVEPDTYILAVGNDYLATQGTEKANERLSSIAFLANTGRLSVTTSNSHGSGLMVNFSLDTLNFAKYEIIPSKEGPGSISPSTKQSYYAGANARFDMVPDNEHCYLKSLLIDDVPVDVLSESGMSYDFSNVRANHKIHAVFDTKKYSIRFEPNGSSNPDYQTGEFTQNVVGGSMDKMDCYCGTKYTLFKNRFTRAGYEFAGWNTKADGSGTSYSDEYADVYNWSSVNDSEITLYAQWRKKLGTETITIISEETGNPVPNVGLCLQKNVDGVWTDVTSGTTNSDGNIAVSNLHWFDYRWVMTDVPVGYESASSHTAFTITYDKLQSTNQVVLYMKRVQIILDSRVSDIISGENAPCFLYSITGTDVAGVSHSYNLMVQTNGSSKFGTNMMSDLFAGTYEITQVPVSRYVAENALSVSHAVGNGINASVDVKNCDSAEVLFPYRLGQYGGFSHTDGVTNKLER